MNNKRGEERIFTIWWFVAIVAISAAIVLATLGFFSKDTDTKEYEAGILYERIVECLVQNGNLRSDFAQGFDIYKECSLKENVFLDNSSFYFEIKLENNFILQGGDKSMKADCNIISTKKVSANNFPGCVNQTELVLKLIDEEVSVGKLTVLTASSQDVSAFFGGKNE
jgi:hypothetical protein